MNRTTVKFGMGVLLILGTGIWLAFSGFEMSKSYYVTISELMAMGEQAYGVQLKVAGDVVDGSITRENQIVRFVISENQHTLSVHYVGKDILPDTFQDGSQAVVEGDYDPDGIFRATHIQAKCASKYEAEYELKKAENIKKAGV